MNLVHNAELKNEIDKFSDCCSGKVGGEKVKGK